MVIIINTVILKVILHLLLSINCIKNKTILLLLL
jgi:hypothetical protein